MKKRASLLFITVIFAFILSMLGIISSPINANANTGTDYSSYASITNFVINTQADFRSFASIYNNKSIYSFNGKTVTLNCDIDLADLEMYFISFQGTFEGNNHKIYNQSKALFGIIGTKNIFPQVKNINFVNAKNTQEFLLAEGNYGTVTAVNYWGNFAPVGTSATKNFLGLVKNNFGTMTNCVNFGTITATRSAKIVGLTENNYGTLSNCHFLGDINYTVFIDSNAFLALLAYNNLIENNTVTPTIPTAGIIDSSTAFVNITFLEDSAPITSPLICLLNFNNGTVASSSITVDIQNAITTTLNQGFVQNNYGTASVKSSYCAYSDFFGMYDQSGVLANFTTDWQSNFVESNLGTQFFYYTNSYPINKGLYLSNGSSAFDELLLTNTSDIYKLRVFYGSDSIYAKLTFDCNLKSLPIIKGLASSTATINFEGQNYAFYQSDKQYIFDSSLDINCLNIGCLATTTVEKICQGSDDDVSIYYDNGSYNYGYSGGATTPIAPSASLNGAGTRVDPYKISSASDLAKLDEQEGFALLTNDIVINSEISPNNSLPLTNLRATLFGGGYSIIGIVNQSFAINNYGSISNLFFRGYIRDNASSIFCSNNYGKITNIIVSGNVSSTSGSLVATTSTDTITDVIAYGTVSGENAAGILSSNSGTLNRVINYATVTSPINNSSGITYQNTGSILLSQNYGNANYGITANQQGTITNTINLVQASFANTYTGINTSINRELGLYRLIRSSTASEHVKLDYLTMNAASYDMTTVFGYEVNTFLDYPTLRVAGKKYKTSLATPFRSYPFGTKTYNSETNYYVEDMELYIKTGATTSASIVWKYNGEPFHDEILHNAGSYVMTANYNGDANYLPARSMQTFVISKAVPPLALEYESFADINATYNGARLEVVTPEPTNKVAIDGYGYVYSESFSRGGVQVNASEIIMPGTYKQTVVFSNKNYFDLTKSRNIVISKANMTLTVGNYQVDYLQSIVWENVGVSLGGLVSADSGKTIGDLVDNYATYFTTNYTSGNNIGQYNLGFSLLTIECYNITVTSGVLTVNPIDLLQGEMSFYFATKGINGSADSFYNGQSQSLVATNLGDGVSVQYQNNTNKDVGHYYPKAIFSKPNYNSLELTVYFEIKKIPLTVTVSNLVRNYGYALNSADFGSVGSGLAQGDTLQSVFSDRPFTYRVYDGVVMQTSGDILDAKSYSIELSIGGIDATNYTVSVESGTLTINKVNLEYLYKNNVQGQSSSFDDYTYIYSGNEYSRIIDYFADNDIEVGIVYKYYLGETLLQSAHPTNAGSYQIIATVTPLGDTTTNFLETNYTCIMIIDKMPISFAFSQPEYTFIYASEDYGVEQNFEYEGTLPEGTTPVFACKKSGVSASAANVGEYNLSYTVNESDNYYGHSATATLKILPKEIGIGIVQNYVFSASAITLVVEIMGVINQEVTLSNLAFTYRNASNIVISAITAVGSYSCSVSLIGNSNYILPTNSYPVTVNPYNIYFEWGTLEYTYGTTGDYSYQGRNYLISTSRVTLRNFLVEELSTSIDIAVTFSGSVSGQFLLQESDIVKPVNYNIYFTELSKTNALNKINVTKRALNVIWRVDGIEFYNQSYEGGYTGLSQTGRWTYMISNFAFSDGIGDVNIDSQVIGSGNDIYHVGDYTLLLTILNNLNYVLANSTITIKIVKVELIITVNNATVERGESYNYPSLSVSGRVGADASKSVDALDEASVVMNTAYSPQSSPVGSKYKISVTATFRNYYAVIIKTGELTVIANMYPDYNLTDAVFVYDGTDKTATISGVAPQVGVVYSNNVHKNAGVYTASAVISYPSGRTKVSTCTITIIKATPTISTTSSSYVYTKNRLLLSSDIVANAQYKGVIVNGSFQFAYEQYLELGTYSQYEITFIPEDTQNYNGVNSFYAITSAEIDFRVFVFDKITDISFRSDTVVEIYAPVLVTLRDVLSGLSLYRDGNRFEGIILEKTETVRLQVRYSGDIVYSVEWDITYIDPNDIEEIEVNEKLLELSGVSFKQEVINVNNMGGRIKLADKYKDSYVLFVNGIEMEEYIVNGNEESLIIMIKSKTIANLTLFAREYSVETVIIENGPLKRSYTTYYIVGGSVLGAVLLVVVVVLVIKKRKF